MTKASPSLICRLKQSKKRLALLFICLLAASTVLILLLGTPQEATEDHSQMELNASMKKNANSDSGKLIDIGEKDDPNSQEMQKLLSQTDAPSVAMDLCLANSIKLSFPYVYITSYSNLKNDPCDSRAFYMMNLASLKAQLETVDKPNKVTRLGPLNYAMTKNLSYSEQPYIHIGVQKFTQYAKIRLGPLDILKNPSIITGGDITKDLAFYPLRTQESISLYWAPDQDAHALVDPDGVVYLLTTFNKKLLPELNRNNLGVLRGLITPPPGWKFVTEKITKPIYINHQSESGFTNTRLTDNLGNIYIKLIQ